MKRQNKITALGILMAFIVFLSSCDKETIDVLPIDPNEEVEEPNGEVSIANQNVLDFVNLKADLAKMNNMDVNAFGTNGAGGRGEARNIARNDSTDDWDDEWYTCAEVTEFEENGVYTVTYDYGDGCEEGDEYYSVFNYGKYTSVFKYDFEFDTANWTGGITGTYEGSMSYENFGSRYAFEDYKSEFALDGTGFFEASFEDEYALEDGTYTSIMESAYQEDLTITEINDGVSVTSTVVADVEEVYESSYNDASDEYSEILTITKADYTYNSEGVVYTSTVVEPLIMNFDCFDYEGDWDDEGDDEDWDDNYALIYVAGIEELSVDGTKYTIDYGDGACDNIISVTDEDGNIVDYDAATGVVIE